MKSACALAAPRRESVERRAQLPRPARGPRRVRAPWAPATPRLQNTGWISGARRGVPLSHARASA
eukprot:12738858-Alexandrium_andersonii.AAC.1